MKQIELDISFNGYSFLVIYGQYINGNFIALPYWNIACNASDPDDLYYNQIHLYQAFVKQRSNFSKSTLKELSLRIAVMIKSQAKENQSIED